MSCALCITKMTRHLIVFRHPFVHCALSLLFWDLLVAVVFSFITNLRLRLCSYIHTYVLSLSLPLVYLLRSISHSSSSSSSI